MRSERYMNLILILFGMCAFGGALAMPIRGDFLRSPGIFPMLCSGILILFGAINVYSSWKKKANEKAGRDCNPFVESTCLTSYVKLGIVFVLCLIYTAVLPILHFVPSTVVFLWVMLALADSKLHVKQGIISALVTVTIQLLFTYGFGVIMP